MLAAGGAAQPFPPALWRAWTLTAVSALPQAVLHGLSAPRETLAHHKLAPGAMRCELHPYQEQALSWMLAREGCAGRGCPSGILADEQVKLPEIFRKPGSRMCIHSHQV